jgi:peptidoglycan/LPS O-acetylase OafA/YrhL
MEKLLKAPTWAIFIYLTASYLLFSIDLSSDPFTGSLIKALGFILSGIYPLSLGIVLTEYLPRKLPISTTLFVINWLIWIGCMILFLILFDGQDISGTGGWLLLVSLYLMFAIIHVHLFPLRILKMVKKRGDVSYGESIGMGFLLIFWPIGLWMIHPEVKNIVDTQVPTAELPDSSK